MRYHYKPPEIYFAEYGKVYKCMHPIYDECTLYLIGKKGLAVIQQRFVPETKATYWGPIDPWIVDDLYLNAGFLNYFNKFASEPDKNGLYPTVTVRQIMWKLRMHPLKREVWETVFDKAPVM